jgi:Peptidase family C25/Propeptide_C25/Peptidase family C25, C terminal ig-like domain/Secretion system C-terminal sorting domain
MRLGKDKQAISLAVFLVFAASASGQTGINYKFHPDGNLQKTEVITGNQSVIINYSISELNIVSLTNNAGSFYRISIPGHIPSSDPGKPELPVFCRLISVPEGSGFKIKISDVRSAKINPSGKKVSGLLYPAQESETKELQQTKPEFRIDKTAYATRGIIQVDTVKIEPLGIVRNNKLANLYISPVRYNPHSNSIEVITSMRIEITFSNSVNISSKSLSSRSELFNESLDKGVLNYNPGQVIPGYSDKPVKMVIITDVAFKKQLQPFFKWKTQKGFKLQILYKGTGLAGNDYVQLKDTLTKIYKASTTTDPPPEYLLIIGDVNRVPYYGSGGTGNITDMYYGEFDGNGDYIPEMFIGRIPVADTNELKTAITKIIQYEKFQFADTNKFYSNAIASAGYDAGYSGYMNGQVKYAVTNYLTKANNINEQHFDYFSGLSATGALDARKDSLVNSIDKGVSFITYTGHGDASGWLHINIKSPDIPSFQNRNMYPFIISNACRTAQFNLSTSFGNRMLLTTDKGAIGFIGCSNDSYWDEDYYWAVGPGTISSDPTYNASGLGAYDRMFHTHGESPSDWYFTMGQINYAGNMAVSASTSSRKKYYWETYNLIGDPSVIPILGTPGTFNVSLPDTLPNGIKSLSLNVDPFAYVAVSHFDTLWDASFATNSGAVVLKMPGLSNDSCLVVITGQNKLPVIKTIRFSNIHKEFINLTASSINDTQGNNNNQADFGESIFLKLTLNNLGLTDSHNLYAKISSTSELVTITSDSVFIGTLPAQSGIVLSNNLGMTISNDAPDLGIATIKLLLKDQSSEKHYSIDICIHAPDLQIINCIIDDSTDGNGDYIPDPGETFNLVFKVRNQGSSNTSGQFSISSPDNNISIVEPNVKSGVLKFGQVTDIPVLVKLSESVPSGDLISVSTTLDCSPYTVNKVFSFRVGKVRESFESSSFNIFPWINISSIPWVITSGNSYDGNVSARSGAISHSGSTSLVIRTVYEKDDSVKFFYSVSSEPNYDFLSFKLNDVEILKKSGEIPWTKAAFSVSAGLNKMEWNYRKDNSVSQGSDCAWIDMIDFTQSSSVKYIQRDLQVARVIIPHNNEQYGQENISVKVLNVGKDTLNGFNLAYEINGNFPPVEQYFNNKVIPYGDSVTVSFKTKADLSKYGIYKIVTYGFDNNDNYAFNDTLTANIENTKIDETLSVYPNPFNDVLTITVNSQTDDKLHISISNVSGVKLYDVEKDIVSGNNSFTISDFRSIPSIYYLNIQGTTINKTIPVIKINR